mmetsp:Transcript_129107/g.237109  ORF Transcript_129107/g.237109 Transcript_129107/m.237109 type:complete len:124 (+) Transcript_129107:1-372(+)
MRGPAAPFNAAASTEGSMSMAIPEDQDLSNLTLIDLQRLAKEAILFRKVRAARRAQSQPNGCDEDVAVRTPTSGEMHDEAPEPPLPALLMQRPDTQVGKPQTQPDPQVLPTPQATAHMVRLRI